MERTSGAVETSGTRGFTMTTMISDDDNNIRVGEKKKEKKKKKKNKKQILSSIHTDRVVAHSYCWPLAESAPYLPAVGFVVSLPSFSSLPSPLLNSHS